MSDSEVRAANFVSSEGVNTRIEYTDGAYAQLATVIFNLNYLGINHSRDGMDVTPGASGTAPLSSYITAADAGIQFDLVIASGISLTTTGGSPTDPSLDQRIATIDQLEEAVPGSVSAVEGANEINNAPVIYNGEGATGTGTDELDAAIALQSDLYKTVHSDSDLANVSVYYFTGYEAGSIPVGPDPASTSGLADDDTQHPYPNFGTAPAFWVSRPQALGNETVVDAQNQALAVYTETGYSSNGGLTGAVDENVQAKYTLDLLLDDAKQGISETYLYQLLDAYAPGSAQGDSGFGLFDYLGNPKPVAVDIHNMNLILSDPASGAASFGLSTLSYSVSGETSTGDDLEMEKSDGSHVIALWDEQPIWNMNTGSEVPPSTHDERVSFGDGSANFNAAVYDPTTGIDPIAVASSVSSLIVPVLDHPEFLIVTDTACYASGTRILCESDEVQVEELQVGDIVQLNSGDRAAIRWLGHLDVDCRRHPRPCDVWPVRILPGAFAPGRPARDLWLSPDHAVLIDEVLIPIRYLVNAVTIVREPRDRVTYWHVEIDRHDLLLAESLACETYLDTGNRSTFANGGPMVQMRPDFAVAVWTSQACAKLVLDGAELEAARSHLLERAICLGFVRTVDPTVIVLSDASIRVVLDFGKSIRVDIEGRASTLRIVSRASVPAEARSNSKDHRRIGICVSAIYLDGCRISLDDRRLHRGWHAVENHGSDIWRWTDGDGWLAVSQCKRVEIDIAQTSVYWVKPCFDMASLDAAD